MALLKLSYLLLFRRVTLYPGLRSKYFRHKGAKAQSGTKIFRVSTYTPIIRIHFDTNF